MAVILGVADEPQRIAKPVLLPGSTVSLNSNMARRTVEPNDGDPVLDVADQRLEDRVKAPVVLKVTDSTAAGLHAYRESQRLRIRVGCERKMLRHPVIGKQEVGR